MIRRRHQRKIIISEEQERTRNNKFSKNQMNNKCVWKRVKVPQGTSCCIYGPFEEWMLFPIFFFLLLTPWSSLVQENISFTSGLITIFINFHFGSLAASDGSKPDNEGCFLIFRSLLDTMMVSLRWCLCIAHLLQEMRRNQF
jgi:hypothetical protein